MNMGTASKAKFWVWEIESCMGMVIGRFEFCRKNMNPDIPMAKAIGIPVRSNKRKTQLTKSILKKLLPGGLKVPSDAI
jgi:hypothetical protein